MPGRYYDVDEEGNIIDPRIVGYSSSNDKNKSEMYSQRDNDYRNQSSPSQSGSPVRHNSPPRHTKTVDRPWLVPVNPLLRNKNDDDSSHRRRHHHHHSHHRHRHHRSRSRSRSRSHSRSYSSSRLRTSNYKSNTPADTTDHWGHELYIEKVILNPDPEPPRSRSNYEPPQEKWISKAGGVAIFTSRPTSASSYQGRRDVP